MKICIITSWFPSFERPNLGTFVAKFASDLAMYDGLEVSVITVLKDGDSHLFQDDHLTITRIKGKFPLLAIYRLIDKINPDIIHVQAPNVFSSAALIVGKLKSLPILATVHRAEVDSSGKLISFIRRVTLASYPRIIAVSSFTKELAIKSGVNPNKILVIHNSCDENLFGIRNKSDARKSCILPLDKKIILYVGSIIEIKGVYILIKALKILLSFGIDFICLLIGRGQEKEKLEKLVKEYNLVANVIFLDWNSPNLLANYYCASDVFVLPSKVEGHSVALLEAMASGLPIIASNIGGNKESVTHGVNGLLFESENENDLAKNIVLLLSDRDLTTKLSENCKRIYDEKFSTRLQISKYVEVYKSLSKA